MSLKNNLAFLFPRSVVKPVSGITKDKADALEETVANNQSAATTLAINTGSVKSMIESYEAGLTEMQFVVADIREIVHSIDNVLQEFEALKSR